MKTHRRTLIAVGDLHGDFYRLKRILSEAQTLDPESLRWTEHAPACDVILLGDYVDWRGEPLEGPREEWPLGPKRLVEFILDLSEQREQLAREGAPAPRFFPLCGNHDAMMLDGSEILEKFCRKEIGLLERFRRAEDLLRFLSSSGLAVQEEEELMRLLNWVQQGGDRTIESFGGLESWMAAMGGRIGNFLKNLPLSVVVNRKLFAHSVPDSKEYWVRLDDHQIKSRDDYPKIKEQYLWGRKVWGIDAFAGIQTSPLSEKEIDEMLAKLNVTAVVVGHTSLRKKAPYFHYGGKVINLDQHGIPGSPALIETYEEAIAPRKKRRRRKRS